MSLGPQSVRLRPAPHCRSRILSYALKVAPEPHFLNWQQDPQSNWIARLVFPEKTRRMDIEVDLVVEMAAYNPFDFFLEPSAEQWPFAYDADLAPDLAPYLRTLPMTPLLNGYLAQIPRDIRATNAFLVELNRKLSTMVAYTVRMEAGLQSPEETLVKGSGSCRDSGWLLVQILRHLGFAARFASGYLIQLAPDTKPLEGPAGPESDFVDLHAWCEVYLPGAGWIGLDPTSGLLAGEGHIPLACTAEPSLAAPVSGLIDRCETTFVHHMTVTRVLETPRVTKPYTEAQWGEVLALGERVDRELEEGDVRLTMGGEPTFIAAADLDAEEWNTAALGPTKKKLATELYHRLRDRYAPEGLVHFGQGKWYPGEPLPRWALNLTWRNDGEPLWKDRSLLADENRPSGATAADAQRLLEAVARRLALEPRFVFPAFEDAFYHLWRERQLPINVDALDPRINEPLERARIARVFAGGLDAPVGSVLPVAFDPKRKGFRTGPWHFRSGHCFLVPGDSPVGLRLPLDSRPWVDPAEQEPLLERDPAQDPGTLASRDEIERATREAEGRAPAAEEERVPAKNESAAWIARAAMCAEPRRGVLYVFMPPTETLDHYVALVAAVEGAAKEIGAPVLLEGYAPPRDPRVTSLSVTPDPGVIEVNIHPARSWKELVAHTVDLYEDARQTRLAAEKFMIDGRHVGTGGGNHIVLGGATPEDSPFLRRPDLLRSLIAYFHQHPSLSFLFSGQFIGPTSQAPRIDEARNDSVAELELAFRELSRTTEEHAKTGGTPPWLVDRLFRDILTDVTGNTHRCEFCIDKLFSPDGPTGRLGLLELRAFEMPPHARMSLTQQLLLRALVARFWKEPFFASRAGIDGRDADRLVRWGTELHDRFMLPHFVWQDFEDVIRDCSSAGYPLRSEWFLPHHEMRFPVLGELATQGIELELRNALEPWHVMGEEATAGGTARYVDSSLERVQVKVRGMAAERFVLTCNGVPVPLQQTGTNGELVAGVRFRAWQPPRCLHPHIGVHAPLLFDLVDRWSKRSLGGCEYHVAHPGGRNHDTRPVNALEAEGRRRARFSITAHTPGVIELGPLPPLDPDFPFTLDLRKHHR
ncbi:MAG: dehydrogenase [Labilithrix sp.]|nr:dehydrogenase [Labilithrix sp.]